jgi:hypothetical protein
VRRICNQANKPFPNIAIGKTVANAGVRHGRPKAAHLGFLKNVIPTKNFVRTFSRDDNFETIPSDESSKQK